MRENKIHVPNHQPDIHMISKHMSHVRLHFGPSSFPIPRSCTSDRRWHRVQRCYRKMGTPAATIFLLAKVVAIEAIDDCYILLPQNFIIIDGFIDGLKCRCSYTTYLYDSLWFMIDDIVL